ARGHHRQERERDEERGEQRKGDREGERGEQLAGDALHVDDRTEHGDRRQRRGRDRLLDLARAERRGRSGGHAALTVAEHVLDDHARVVHQQADAECESACWWTTRSWSSRTCSATVSAIELSTSMPTPSASPPRLMILIET